MDPLLPFVSWIEPVLQQPFPDEFAPGSVEHKILSALRDGWGTVTAGKGIAEKAPTGFSPLIEFDRTETLMEGGPFCNHHYRLRGGSLG